MAIDGVIVLDNTGRPIIQSGFRAAPPAYPAIHIDALNDALSKASSGSGVDPVLYVPTPGVEGSTSSACCHVEIGGMRILAPVSGDLDPLYAFAFLQTFIDILTEYFGEVSTPKLRDNFDIVYQLLEETLDSIGHPLTTSPNALRDIVLPPTLLSKVLSAAGASSLSGSLTSSPAPNPFASAIPWRKAHVRHAQNEIYFDVVEELRAVVNKSGTPLNTTVIGRIETNARLSGTPDITLSFINSQHMGNPAFHPCVRLQRWTRDRSLSFVPPDGKFVLAEYRYSPAPALGGVASATPSLTQVSQVPVPIALKSSVSLHDGGGNIELTLTSRTGGKPLSSIRIELFLGQTASGASCSTSGAGSDASWTFDPARRVLRWDIPTLGTGAAILKGTFTTTAYPRPARAFQISFEIPQHSFSALKVDQLRLTGEQYKPYKGFRARSGGKVEWRW